VCKKLLKILNRLGKNVRKPQGGGNFRLILYTLYITGAGNQESNFPVVLGLAVVIATSLLLPADP